MKGDCDTHRSANPGERRGAAILKFVRGLCRDDSRKSISLWAEGRCQSLPCALCRSIIAGPEHTAPVNQIHKPSINSMAYMSRPSSGRAQPKPPWFPAPGPPLYISHSTASKAHRLRVSGIWMTLNECSRPPRARQTAAEISIMLLLRHDVYAFRARWLVKPMCACLCTAQPIGRDVERLWETRVSASGEDVARKGAGDRWDPAHAMTWQ